MGNKERLFVLNIIKAALMKQSLTNIEASLVK